MYFRFISSHFRGRLVVQVPLDILENHQQYVCLNIDLSIFVIINITTINLKNGAKYVCLQSILSPTRRISLIRNKCSLIPV